MNITAILLIAVGVFAMSQRVYYRKMIERLIELEEREMKKARSEGRGEGFQMAVNDPKVIVKRYHQMFTYTMN